MRLWFAVPFAVGLSQLAVWGCAPHAADAAFWFEEVTYESPLLGEPLTPADLQTIDAIARAELTAAFSGMRFTLRKGLTPPIGFV